MKKRPLRTSTIFLRVGLALLIIGILFGVADSNLYMVSGLFELFGFISLVIGGLRRTYGK